MAEVREIIKLGDSILKQQAMPVKRFNDQLGTLLDDMAATMYAAGGVGLAAPQIGVSKCVVVIDEGAGAGLMELVNPVIVAKSGRETAVEYCLSVPERGGEVVRATKVTVTYQDRHGQHCQTQAEGWLARIIQHEIDHLHGITFVDIMIREVRD